MTNKFSIQFKTSDYIIIGLAIFLLLTTWLYAIVAYPNLPETIAVHFDGAGNPNGYNSKSSLWLMPIVFSALTILMFYGAKNPIKFDFSKKIKTQEEALISRKLLLLSGLLLSSLSLLIAHSMIATSLDKAANPKWVMKVVIGLIILYVIAAFYLQFKLSKK